MTTAHQPGAKPIEAPETIPNPIIVPSPTPKEPIRKPNIPVPPAKVPEPA